MDKANIGHRVKKYFFLISIVFIVVTSAHLYYSFLYSDAKETAIKGGSISEGLIGKVPSLNPLKNNSSEDRYVNSILYRSLLKYDPVKGKIIGDLAECDYKNLLNVKCILKANSKWSNGEDIVKDDVVETFNILKDKKINQELYRLLKNVTVSKTDEGISFKSTTKNIQLLKIFFQPIVSHKVLNLISKKELEGSFQLSNGVYSGKYIVKNIIPEENTNITTIVLSRNKEYFKNPVYIDIIFLKIFPDLETFSKNKDSINIFNYTNGIIGENIGRFENNEYVLPQYTNLFSNIDKIKNNKIRKFIFDQIDKDEIVKYLLEDKDKKYKVNKITDPYLSDIYIKKDNTEISLKKELEKEGYFSKEYLLDKYSKLLKIEELKTSSNISGEVSINKISGEQKIIENKKTEKKVEEEKNKVVSNSKIINSKSKIIISPSWVDKYNFVRKNNYLLKGSVSKNTTKVFVNDYELRGFKPYSNRFNYRISLRNGNFKKGQNNYKIYFVIDGKKKLVDEINFYYNTNKDILKKEEKKLFSKNIENNIENKKEKTIIKEDKAEIKKEEIKKVENSNNLEKNTKLDEKNNKKELLGKTKENKNILKNKINKKIVEIKNKISKIEKLDKKYFYNNDLKKYSLELYYTIGKGFYKKTAEYIKEKLEKKGIFVEIRDLRATDLDKLLKEGKDNYDLLLVGINLSYIKSDISVYYHSKVYSHKEKKWVNNPYNLSNYKGLDIEIPLEELREGILNSDIIEKTESKVLKVIYDNNLSKTLFTPVLSNFVDKNIKGYNLNKNIPESFYRFEGLNKSYVKKEKKFSKKDKNILEYFKFLFKTLSN